MELDGSTTPPPCSAFTPWHPRDGQEGQRWLWDPQVGLGLPWGGDAIAICWGWGAIPKLQRGQQPRWGDGDTGGEGVKSPRVGSVLDFGEWDCCADKEGGRHPLKPPHPSPRCLHPLRQQHGPIHLLLTAAGPALSRR